MNLKVQEYNLKIDGKKYTFRLDFEALIKFEEKYPNALGIFNEFLQGKKIYPSIIKILSCACKEKDWAEQELSEKIPFSFGTMKLFDSIVMELTKEVYTESLDGEKNEKND